MDQYIHPIDKIEAACRRSYPWQKCDELERKAFLCWQGKRLNQLSKNPVFSDFEMGLRNVLNGQKTEYELEKLMASWDAFQREKQQGELTAQQAVAALEQSATIVPVAPVGCTPEGHLARLRAMWQWPKHQQFVRDRVAANPGWGIVIGPEGPELRR